jgi:uroporphyrinogen-III decarboxylase
MGPLASLPSFKKMWSGYAGLQIAASLADPQMVAAFKAFYEAGLQMQKQGVVMESLQKEIRSEGFAPVAGSGSLPPFDVVSDSLRGMRGVMLDMYRRPDKLLEAIDKILAYLVKTLVASADASGNPRAMLGMHRGSDGFLSKQQWETFYWPGYKKLALALIEEGISPVFFLEGNVTSRLEYFTELPKGWAMGIFDTTDIYQAKKVLGNTMCISGMMPVSLLQVGTPDEVKAYARKLIDVVGKDGGFIMGPRSVLDEVNPDLVKVWADFTRDYGRYQ